VIFALQCLDHPTDEESIEKLLAARQEYEGLPEKRTEETGEALLLKYDLHFSSDAEVEGSR